MKATGRTQAMMQLRWPDLGTGRADLADGAGGDVPVVGEELKAIAAASVPDSEAHLDNLISDWTP